MDNLNVYVNNQTNNQTGPQKIKSFFTVPKIIFAVLGIVILVEVIIVIRSLISPASSLPQVSNQAGVVSTTAKISLNTAKTSLRAGEGVSVAVAVDTGEKAVSGADLIVRFDPKVLEASGTAIIKGKIFDEYPLVSVDAKNGLISISGVSSLNKSFKGSGQFALINFKAKTPGKTSLTIDFKKGSTTASNLVDVSTSQNILDTVDNLELEIQ
ncbi:hypothetical protein A3I48_02410 [Candidatus Daviesbacteria bacterium RIFCSPLOWO2_02_FULL_36_7]|uniref:Cohesin domain-containing protein n=1 Tax=Candidatus Daviesbacteria bacterium RIFCSPLOWO2_02_FULL_36_7 TaxID=1797792 RepID=A0A1F5MI99_9BACT|nr:MAG: hypothetical protein A3I48_02410 [Candidatus Daviesbacteria bacterium RIFCSPLOWO2_02_FULL_36_7]